MTAESRPPDAQYLMWGRYYKIGRFGFVYVWVNFGWQRTTVTKDQLGAKNVSRYRKVNNEKYKRSSA